MTLHDLTGVWRRSLLAWPDGDRDTTTTVLWVQGPTLYADLRLPSAARPECFAGELVLDDGVFKWCRRIDLGPPGPYGDRGRPAFDGDVLVEDGAEFTYASGEPEVSIGRLDGDHWVVGWSSRPDVIGERRPLEAGGWQVAYIEGEGL